jgi:hypothetical protein
MGTVSKKEIIQKMEELNNGVRLRFRLSPTFGAVTVIIELNPAHKEKGQKKYLMWWGRNEEQARASSPFMSSDKAKGMASWVAERAAEWVVN